MKRDHEKGNGDGDGRLAVVPSEVVAAVTAATEAAIVAAAEVVAAAAAVACSADGRGAETGDDGDGKYQLGNRVVIRGEEVTPFFSMLLDKYS